MVRYTYYSYNYECQVCGKKTKTKKNPAVGNIKIPICQVCNKKLCNNCRMGGFCETCINLFPEEIRKPYEKKAKSLKNIPIIVKIIMWLANVTFIAGIIALLIGTEIALYIFIVSFIFMGIFFCPGLLAQSIVNSSESIHSGTEARRLIREQKQL